jgi:hypothetical protein
MVTSNKVIRIKQVTVMIKMDHLMNMIKITDTRIISLTNRIKKMDTDLLETTTDMDRQSFQNMSVICWNQIRIP